MEYRFQFWLEFELHDHLRNAIRDRWNSQQTLATASFGDRYRAYRRWKVTARGDPIPDPVQVVLQIPLKIRDGLLIHARCASVRLYPLVRLPYQLLGNTERLCPTRSGSSSFRLASR